MEKWGITWICVTKDTENTFDSVEMAIKSKK